MAIHQRRHQPSNARHVDKGRLNMKLNAMVRKICFKEQEINRMDGVEIKFQGEECKLLSGTLKFGLENVLIISIQGFVFNCFDVWLAFQAIAGSGRHQVVSAPWTDSERRDCMFFRFSSYLKSTWIRDELQCLNAKQFHLVQHTLQSNNAGHLKGKSQISVQLVLQFKEWPCYRVTFCWMHQL